MQTLKANNYNAFYYFDPNVDGYPETAPYVVPGGGYATQQAQEKGTPAPRVVGNYKVRAIIHNKQGYTSESPWAQVDSTGYGTWQPVGFDVTQHIAGRTVVLSMKKRASTQECYGTFFYRISIKRLGSGVDSAGAPVADSAWYAPNLTSDPYLREDAYKDTSKEYIDWMGDTFQQTLPLLQQEQDPQATTYQYRIVAGIKETNMWTADSFVTAAALATGAKDLVTSAITENKLAPGCVVAEKLHAGCITSEKFATKDLSAMQCTLGRVSSDKIMANANNYWDLQSGEFKIANNYSESDSRAEYFKYQNGSFAFKIANFIVSSISSVIKGLFQVQHKTNDTVALEVNPDVNTTNINTATTNINGTTNIKSMLSINNSSGACKVGVDASSPTPLYVHGNAQVDNTLQTSGLNANWIQSGTFNTFYKTWRYDLNTGAVSSVVYLLLGKCQIDDSTANDTGGPYCWDKVGTLTITRPSGHTQDTAHFYACTGYAYRFITAGAIETITTHASFMIGTVKYNGFYYIAIRVQRPCPEFYCHANYFYRTYKGNQDEMILCDESKGQGAITQWLEFQGHNRMTRRISSPTYFDSTLQADSATIPTLAGNVAIGGQVSASSATIPTLNGNVNVTGTLQAGGCRTH